MSDEYQARLLKMRETIGLRLDAARASLAALETEYDDIEVALRVHERITDGSAKSRGNGSDHKPALSQQKLILAILADASPQRLAVREICRIAREQHGREIPATSVGSVLTNAKKSGRVVHQDSTWGAKMENESASGKASPEASSSDGQTSAEPSLHSEWQKGDSHGSSGP